MQTKGAIAQSHQFKAHRTAANLLKKGAFPDVSDVQKGGLNSKLHAVCNASGRPVAFHLTSGQVSDYKGASVFFLEQNLETKAGISGDKSRNSGQLGCLCAPVLPIHPQNWGKAQ